MLVILVHLLVFIKFLGITLDCDLKYLFCQILIKIWRNENEQLEEINIFAVTAVVMQELNILVLSGLHLQIRCKWKYTQ